MRVKLLIILAFVVFSPFPQLATALSLSDVELQSHLNQRLSVRIKLQSARVEDLEGMNIKVSMIADRIAGGGHTNLTHEIVKEGSTHYLMITSRDVVREPILSFVVELNWSSGHLLRDYALIIDPQ